MVWKIQCPNIPMMLYIYFFFNLFFFILFCIILGPRQQQWHHYQREAGQASGAGLSKTPWDTATWGSSSHTGGCTFWIASLFALSLSLLVVIVVVVEVGLMRQLKLSSIKIPALSHQNNQPSHLSNCIFLFATHWHPKRDCNSTSCVSFRAPRCCDDVCRPLRQGWPGCSALASRWWTTIVARRWRPRWMPQSSAWGASRWTSGQCRLCSSRRRAGACSNCLWTARLRKRSPVMETGRLLSRSCRSAPSVAEWLGGTKASLCDLTSEQHVHLSLTFVRVPFTF